MPQTQPQPASQAVHRFCVSVCWHAVAPCFTFQEMRADKRRPSRRCAACADRADCTEGHSTLRDAMHANAYARALRAHRRLCWTAALLSLPRAKQLARAHPNPDGDIPFTAAGEAAGSVQGGHHRGGRQATRAGSVSGPARHDQPLQLGSLHRHAAGCRQVPAPALQCF